MNKQELIKKVKALEGYNSAFSRDYEVGHDECMDKVVLLIEQLDEPQKVKVPTYVAEWIESAKEEERSLYQVFEDIYGCCFYHNESEIVTKWLFGYEESPENQRTFARAYLDSYEGEVKPKYRVNIGGLYLIEPLGDTNDYTIRMTLKKEYAYTFDSWNMAREHTSELGGTIEKV